MKGFAQNSLCMYMGREMRGLDRLSNPDRRGNSRFPLQQDLQYKVLHRAATKIVGSGKTLNIASGGILFTTQERLPLGRTVELSVNWPARLGGTCALKFVAVGRVVRAE